MKKTMKASLGKAAFAALLMTGVATAALAQEHDRGDRGDRGGDRRGGGQPPAAQASAPSTAPAPQAAPAQRPQFERTDRGPRSEGWQSPQGGHARFGAPPPSGAAPAVAPAPAAPVAVTPSGRGGDRFNGDRFNGGERHGDRGGPGNPGAPPTRTFDHARGPGEVTPPTGAVERSWDGRRDDRRTDGRDTRDGRWSGRDGRDGRDGRWDGRDHRDDHRDGRWPNGRQAERWQSGRYPPVYWSHDRYRHGAYRAPYGFYVRSWAFGDILPRGWYGPDYYIDDFLDFGLPYPPPGYEWVRVGGDALLIDEYTGRIVQVVRGIFY